MVLANIYVHVINVVSMHRDVAMVLPVSEHDLENFQSSILPFIDCPSMEDEQGCSSSTISYCRADQFRCGTTCIPNVSYRKLFRLMFLICICSYR